MRVSQKIFHMVSPFLFGIALLALWELAVRVNSVPEYILPGPRAILIALWIDGPDLLVGLLITLQVTLAALVLAAVTGAGIAMILAQTRLIEKTLFPYAVFLQVTPIVTIAPFVIIWVENVYLVLLLLAWMAAVFPVISNTLTGLKSADSNLRELFQLYGANNWEVLTRLLVPTGLPFFLAGLRISGGLALIGAVVAEMVAGTAGTRSGLASRLLEASYRLELPRAFAAFFLLSLAGFSIYLILQWISHLMLRNWHESERLHER